MFNKRILLATSALAVLASANQAYAGDFYVSVFGGANLQTNNKAGFTSSSPFTATGYHLDSDVGFAIGGAAGIHLDQFISGLRAEVEASYRRNSLNGNWFVTTFFTTQGGAVHAHDSQFALMANVWYDINVGRKWRPYIGGGAGWSRRTVSGAFATTYTSNLTPASYGHGFDVHESGFAWQVGAGVNYDVQDGVRLGLGYRYFRGPDIKND